MNNEKINHTAIHFMIDTVIKSIDEKKSRIRQFQSEPLFINIYYCFYFVKFLSPYKYWHDEIIETLKNNIRNKWVNNLPNIDYFIKQIEIRNKELDPFEYWFHSEDYFEKVMLLKEISDVLFPAKKKENKKKHYFKVYKPIR